MIKAQRRRHCVLVELTPIRYSSKVQASGVGVHIDLLTPSLSMNERLRPQLSVQKGGTSILRAYLFQRCDGGRSSPAYHG